MGLFPTFSDFNLGLELLLFGQVFFNAPELIGVFGVSVVFICLTIAARLSEFCNIRFIPDSFGRRCPRELVLALLVRPSLPESRSPTPRVGWFSLGGPQNTRLA